MTDLTFTELREIIKEMDVKLQRYNHLIRTSQGSDESQKWFEACAKSDESKIKYLAQTELENRLKSLIS